MSLPVISSRLHELDGSHVWGRLSLYEREVRLRYVGLRHAGLRRILLAEIRSATWLENIQGNLVLRLSNGTTHRLGVARAELIKHELERRRRRLPVRITRRVGGAILHQKGDETFREIQLAYRMKIVWYHPDKLAQLAPEQRRAEEEEAQKLTDAYAYFRGVRRFE